MRVISEDMFILITVKFIIYYLFIIFSRITFTSASQQFCRTVSKNLTVQLKSKNISNDKKK